MSESTASHCGFIAIIGRPNVGKSTLINRLIGEKVSITSRKPQTTRHQIIGINTQDNTQLIYIDTPGIHRGEVKAINRHMNRAARSAMADVDAVVFVVSAMHWTPEDEYVLSLLQYTKCPVILAVNKVDKVPDKEILLPFLKDIASRYNFHSVFPLSAKQGANVLELEKLLTSLMPEGPFHFAEDQVTDKSLRFMVAELIREKLIRLTGQELPYSTAVEIEEFKDDNGLMRISALILVEKDGQKRIVIGNKGDKLKEIGTSARLDIEKLLECKVFLRLWIKVKSGWSDDERALQSLGFQNDK